VPSSRITFGTGETVDVEGDLEQVTDELHKVFSRRESTFAMLQDAAGRPIAIRPDAVIHVRPVGLDPPPSA
jgi:hypothetical protein